MPTSEIEKKKRAVFDGMAPKRQERILKNGYENWDPFAPPKDPIDIRKDISGQTAAELVAQFISSSSNGCASSHAYAKGALEICLGIINSDDRCMGMYDFSCWYTDLVRPLKKGNEDDVESPNN